MLKRIYCSFVFLLTLLSLTFNASAQSCDPPTGMTFDSRPDWCIGSGGITVTSVTGGSNGNIVEYRIDSSNVWQSGNIFENVLGGNHIISVRYVCGSNYSSIYSDMVSVENYGYSPPSFNSVNPVTVNRYPFCNDGKITINASASGARGPLTYALVISQNVDEINTPNPYVRPKQPSNVFDNLSAGTYYVRIYDACNGSVTREINLPQQTAVNMKPYNSFMLSTVGCDMAQMRMINNSSFRFTAGEDYIRTWVVYPNNTVDTILTNYNNMMYTFFSFPLEKFGTSINNNSFPDNLDPNSWPKKIVIGNTLRCGLVITDTITYNKPTFYSELIRQDDYSNCNEIAYRFYGLSDQSYSKFYTPNFVNGSAAVSIDSGATWIHNNYTYDNNFYYTPIFKLPVNTNTKVLFAMCNDTTEHIVNSNPNPILMSVQESTYYACKGKSSLIFTKAFGAGNITISMVSAPPGEPLAPSLQMNGNSSTISFFNFRNLALGTYVFSYSDSCNTIVYDTLTIFKAADSVTISTNENCNDELNITLNTPVNYVGDAKDINSYTTVNTSYGIKARLINQNNDTVITMQNSYNNSLTMNTSNLPLGNYTLKIYKVAFGVLENCGEEFIYIKENTPLSILRHSTINVCDTNYPSGTIIATKSGGKGGARFSLFKDSITTTNLVAGPTYDSVFNNLDTASTYYLTLSDTCGSTVSTAVTFTNQSPRIFSSTHSLSPCMGDNITFNIDSVSGAQYSWYRNDTLLPNANSNVLTINNFQQSDSGVYTGSITAGTCALYLNTINIDPNNCNQPLYLNWLYFNAIVKNEESHLEWATTQEIDNKLFEIERSSNGVNWSIIGSVLPNVNHADAINKYHFIDQNPLINKNYYRIKQIDFDNRSSYSNTKTVYLNNINKIEIYPNPAKDYVKISNLNHVKTISLVDMRGVTIQSINNINSSSINIPTTLISAGIYMIQIQFNDGSIESYKLNIL